MKINIKPWVFIGILVYSVSNAYGYELLSSQNLSTSAQGTGKSSYAKSKDIANVTINPASIIADPYFSGYAYQAASEDSVNISHAGVFLTLQDYHFGAYASATSPIQLTEINDFGQTAGTYNNQETLFAIVGGTSYKINNSNSLWSKIFSGHYDTGIALKYLRWSILEYNVNIYSFDAGVIWDKNISVLKFLPYRRPYNTAFSLSLRNIGHSYTIVSEAESQQYEIATGMRYGIFSNVTHDIQLYTKYQYDPFLTHSPGAGLEYTLWDFVTMRVGTEYALNDFQPAGGLGFGYKINDLYFIRADYASTLRPDIGFQHNFSFQFEYRRGEIAQKLEIANKEAEKLNTEIDEENRKILQACVKDYYLLEEKYPQELKNTTSCIKKYGLSEVPEAFTGTWDYNPIAGTVALVSFSQPKTFQDKLHLKDGSVLTINIIGTTEEKVLVQSNVGKSFIDKGLIKYAVIAYIPQEDKDILKDVQQVSENVKTMTGSYPQSFSELISFYEAETGAKPPVLERGKLDYLAANGQVRIIDNYPPN